MAAAVAAVAAVGVVAAGFAIYAMLLPLWGRAGAAAAVAAVFALIVIVVGIATAMSLGGGRRKARGADLSNVELLIDVLRDKPLIAAVIAVITGVLAMRDPQTVAAVIRAFLEGWRGSRSTEK